jgi:hypothetical protein
MRQTIFMILKEDSTRCIRPAGCPLDVTEDSLAECAGVPPPLAADFSLVSYNIGIIQKVYRAGASFF